MHEIFRAIVFKYLDLASIKLVDTSFRLLLHPPFEHTNKTPHKTTSFIDDDGILIVFEIPDNY